MERSSLRPGQLLATLGAIGLFCSLFAPWYRFDIGSTLREGLRAGAQQYLAEPLRGLATSAIAGLPASVSFSGWRAFDVTDVALTVAAVLVLGLTLASAGAFGGGLIARPASAGRITGAIGLAAAVIVIGRILDQPGPNEILKVAYGAWLALAAAISMAVGGWWATFERARVGQPLASTDLAFEPAAPGSLPPPSSV
jgi:hypothetical protein